MALNLDGFVTPEENFSGLYKAADTLREQGIRNERVQERKDAQNTATSKFLTDYLDPKDHLTGTAYDPQIVSGLQDVLQQGQQLASQGVDTNNILMALGPKVAKLNQYSTTAKTINQRIKDQVARLKTYGGYNTEALQSQALKSAFYGPDGKLKDISSVDPNQDWVSEAVKNNPESVTTSKGLDDLVAKTPMADYSRTIRTAYGGRSRDVKYEAKHPYWEDLQRDESGNPVLDQAGNPIGLGIVGGAIKDDKGNTVVDPSTAKPMMALNKNVFNAIMSHNPDIADYVRGQVNKHFKEAGAQSLPAEGSPQWETMARHILGDELKTRSRSYFRTIDQQKETAPAVKVELGQNPDALDALAKYQEAQRLKGEYAVYDPKSGKTVKTNAVQTIGKIFNNDPAFLQGETEDVNGRSVVNVTDVFPGGGLKSGRGDDHTFKAIWYDPAKRSLLVSNQGKQKDASGTKPISIEEIPENKVGQFMARIAAANGVDPSKVSELMEEMGYHGAKFKNAVSAENTNKRVEEEHAQKVDNALKNNKFEDLSGVAVKDGIITEISERSKSSWIPGVDRYAVFVKTPEGKTIKAFTTSNKGELENYIKNKKAIANSGGLDEREKDFIKKAAATEAKNAGASGIKWQ